MKKTYKAKVFESAPKSINSGDIVEINFEIPSSPIQSYSVVEGVISGLEPGNYVLELQQLRNGDIIPFSKYTYIASYGEEKITYGFAYRLLSITTELRINVYVVAK